METSATATAQPVLQNVYAQMDQVREGNLGHLGALISMLEQAPEGDAVRHLRDRLAELVMLSGDEFDAAHTALKAAILEAAEQSASPTDGSAAAEAPKDGDDPAAATLYARLGGEGAIKAVVETFYAAVLGDGVLAPYFVGQDMDGLKRHQVRFLSQVAGGPKQYDGRQMAAAHQPLGITDDHFDRVADHLANALGAHGVTAGDIDSVLEAANGLRTQIVSQAAPAPAPAAAAGPAPAAKPAPAAAHVHSPSEMDGMGIDQALYVEFVEESLSHLETIELNFLSLETDPGNKTIIDNIFRPFYTIKGVSGFLGLTGINRVCHAVENLLDEGRKGNLEITGRIADLVLEIVDFLKMMIPVVRESAQPQAELQQHEPQVEAALARIVAVREAAGKETSEEGLAARPLGEILTSMEAVSPELLAQAIEIQRQQGGNLGEILIRKQAVKPIAVAHALRDQHKARETQGQREKAPAESAAAGGMDSIRVRINLLDQLMNLAGELVLGRNQLLQKMSAQADEVQGLNSILHDLDRVTSEVQEAVMQTRMQPMGSLFSRFHRVVRDLSRSMGKQIELHIEGEGVELDKTLIEALTDPLTHLVRNCCDHGVETPEKRRAAGKAEKGRVSLVAEHAGGKVHVTVKDDGAGVNIERVKEKAIENGIVSREQAANMSEREALRLLFQPGFSTAQVVTDVSGRGVGMDVVISNIQKIGGTVEVTSELGQGTTFLLDLPLTLAIVPALIVSTGEQRFAMPQTNILELVRLEPQDVARSIREVRGSEVLDLRGEMLPLIRLDRVLNLERPQTAGDGAEEAVSIAVVASGIHQFGLVVDRVFDTEEIVVKPLSSLLKNVGVFDGATLMGNGQAALILDVAGLMRAAELSIDEDTAGDRLDHKGDASGRDGDDLQTLLLFDINPAERLAVPLNLISRLETVRMGDIRNSIQGKVMPYRNRLLPLIFREEHTKISPPAHERDLVKVLVFEIEHPVGLVVTDIVDSTQTVVQMDDAGITQPGFTGIAMVDGEATAFVDIYEVIELAFPDWFKRAKRGQPGLERKTGHTLLLAEDSSFYRNVERNYLVQEGFHVLEAADGKQALEILQREPVDLLVTDIEMPHLNGFELATAVRQTPGLDGLPIIAVTSLSDEAEREKGMRVGIYAYLIKLQREQLLKEVNRLLLTQRKAS